MPETRPLRSRRSSRAALARERRKKLTRPLVLAGVALLIAVVAVAVVLAPLAMLAAERFVEWTFSEVDGGLAQIEPGDRYTEVAFSTPFRAPPILTVTPQQLLGSGSFAVANVDEKGFRLEVSEPAPTPLPFVWAALSGVRTQLLHLEDRGLPSTLVAFTGGGDAFTVHLEAYRDDRPVALRVSDTELVSRIEDEVAAAAVEAARGWYNEFFTCSLLERVRRRFRARAYPCPAWGTSPLLPSWRAAEADRWVVERTGRGLEIVEGRTLASEPSPDAVETARQWAALVEDSLAVDLMSHNNQVLDFVDALIEDGVLESDGALSVIHFDAHSDLHVYPDPARRSNREDISDFLNTLIGDGRVREVYWVLPEWTREDAYRELYWEAPLSLEAEGPYAAGPQVLEILVDDTQGLLYFDEPTHAADLRRVWFHKVVLEELPSFAGRDDVYLEIDGDYFSNTGFDTEWQGRRNPTRMQMLAELARVAEVLHERGVQPRIVSWCLSPSYTAPEDEIEQERFFLEVMRLAQTEDYLLSYAHADVDGVRVDAVTRRRAGPMGRYLAALREGHLTRPDADRRIRLEAEGDDALALAAAHLGLGERDARRLLGRLDAFDGRLDGVIDLADLEYYAGVGDLDALLGATATPLSAAPP